MTEEYDLMLPSGTPIAGIRTITEWTIEVNVTMKAIDEIYSDPCFPNLMIAQELELWFDTLMLMRPVSEIEMGGEQ